MGHIAYLPVSPVSSISRSLVVELKTVFGADNTVFEQMALQLGHAYMKLDITPFHSDDGYTVTEEWAGQAAEQVASMWKQVRREEAEKRRMWWRLRRGEINEKEGEEEGEEENGDDERDDNDREDEHEERVQTEVEEAAP